MKKIIAIVMAALMIAAMFAGCGGEGKGEQAGSTKTEFVIGMSGPLTGGASVYGIAVKNAAQMAVDEINAAGGLNGYKFKLIATDDQHDATKVATNYANLISQGMQVSLGTVTTAPGEEFKTLAKEDNIFFLTPSASGDKITLLPITFALSCVQHVDCELTQKQNRHLPPVKGRISFRHTMQQFHYVASAQSLDPALLKHGCQHEQPH